MIHYSQFEQKIAKILSRFPIVKMIIKYAYRVANHICFKKKYTYTTIIPIKKYSYQNCETFFGYYDKSPENITGEYLIYHASSYPTFKLPNAFKPIYIVLYDLKKNKYYTHTSCAYNWQQGARLQWVNNQQFIFNDYDFKNKIFISKLINVVEPQKFEVIPFTIYDVFNKHVLTLNYTRLNFFSPDYGYRNETKITLNDERDGIFYANLDTFEYRLLYSLNYIKIIEPQKVFNYATHTVNHIMFSPNGKQFIFLHRYYYKGCRYDRLMLGDVEGSKPFVLSRYSMVSHYCWYNEKIIIVFMEDKDGYTFYKIDVENVSIEPLYFLTKQGFNDGHPSVNNHIMIFDTYPDKASMKSLYMYSLTDQGICRLGEFLEPLRFNEQTRCDLHPRFNFSGNRVYFDSTHLGKRYLFSINFVNDDGTTNILAKNFGENKVIIK